MSQLVTNPFCRCMEPATNAKDEAECETLLRSIKSREVPGLKEKLALMTRKVEERFPDTDEEPLPSPPSILGTPEEQAERGRQLRKENMRRIHGNNVPDDEEDEEEESEVATENGAFVMNSTEVLARERRKELRKRGIIVNAAAPPVYLR